MSVVVDIIFGLVLPYAVLPAFLIATIIKIRSWKIRTALLVLVISAFCYGMAIGIFMQKRQDRRENQQRDILGPRASRNLSSDLDTIEDDR